MMGESCKRHPNNVLFHPFMTTKSIATNNISKDLCCKHPCIHPTIYTSTKLTTELLEQDFAHFGYPHTIVSDNATTFYSSEEFQPWCQERGITHLTGTPNHPATNEAAESLVQSFKQAFSLPLRAAFRSS